MSIGDDRNEWDERNELDFMWYQKELEEQELTEQKQKEKLGSHGVADWNIFESIFVTPHKYTTKKD